MKELLRRAWYLGRRSQFDRELDDEIQFHIQSRAEELHNEGVPPHAALEQARREFGSRARVREETRGAWQIHWMDDLWSDLHYAARAFRRNPAFALTAMACLVLGILPNTVLFNLAANALLSRPSVRDPKTLYGVFLGGNTSTPMREYRFVRNAKPFEGFIGMNIGTANWSHDDKAEPLDAARVTDHFFEVTGIPLALGRPIQSGETDVVVVSNPFWKYRLAGDPNVLGRRIELDGRVYTIAGVLPPDHRTLFTFGMSVDFYLPVPSDNWTVWLYARLPPGLTPQAASDRLKPVLQELDRVYPDPNQRWSDNNAFFYEPYGPGFLQLGEQIGIPLIAYLAMLMIVVGLVLLMACANVSGLLLARASARREELAIRFSLGAAGGRIVRQLLAESLLLVLGATVAGLLITVSLNPVVARLLEGKAVLQPDWRLLFYSAAIAAVATFVSGLMPALNSSRSGIYSALKKDSRHHHWTLRGALVVGQLAVSVVLLSAGLLFLRNLQRAGTVNPGFDVDHTVRANMHLIAEAYSQPKRRILIDTALERLRTAPGIESAGVAAMVPLVGFRMSQEDWTTAENAQVVHLDARENEVGPEYFRTLQIPILQGREFLRSDGEGSPRVIILNQTMSRRLFGTSNAVGQVVHSKNGPPLLVVGVARDSKYWSLSEENVNAYYQSYFQTAGAPSTQATDLSDLYFLIRASGPAATVVSAANKVLTQLDSSAALDIKPMRENLKNAMGPSQLGASVLGSMGLLGLFLASVGLYGVLLYTVSRRTREIGLRVALGATRLDVLRMVVGESAILVGGGIAIGLGLAAFAVRPLSMFLIQGVRPTDATNFVTVAATLCLVASIATIAPTLRALRADPMTALRHE